MKHEIITGGVRAGKATITFLIDNDLKRDFKMHCISSNTTVTDVLVNLIKGICENGEEEILPSTGRVDNDS